MVDINEYPYLASWCESDPINIEPFDCTWIYWNGISMTWPLRVKIRPQDKIYTWEEFKKIKGW